MSLRITPNPSHPTSTANTHKSSTSQPNHSAPSAPGLHDTLRASHSTPSSSSSTNTTPLTSTHPLEARLAHWTSTQETLHHTLLRRNFGIAEPLRRGMELKLVRNADAFRPSALGAAAGVHEDILTGRDGSVDWEDVYGNQDGVKNGAESVRGGGWAEEMETKVGMGKW